MPPPCFSYLYYNSPPLFSKHLDRIAYKLPPILEPSLYRKKTACLDTDCRLRFSETLRTFTKTPQFGADVPDTSVPLFQPLRVRYPRNLQVAWITFLFHCHFLKKTTKTTTFTSPPRAKQHFFSPEKTRKSINIRVHGKRSEKGRGKKRSERGQKRTVFTTKRTLFLTNGQVFRGNGHI